MASVRELPYGDGGDSRAAGLALAERFRRHAGSLAANGRSPLYARLMDDAADDLERGGVVARLFDGIPAPPGSVPQLRLLAALHELVLSGADPRLAGFYPSAGGSQPPELAWPVAADALAENFDWIRPRLTRTVQTNDPGRSVVLFAVLLSLADTYGLPIRLLEIGASAGLNLLVDRYCYVVGGDTLGDPLSEVRFDEPWSPPPPIAVGDAARRLRIVSRAGCDRAPLDPRDPEHRLRLESYIWPDELERLRRLRAALDQAAGDPPPVTAAAAVDWLAAALARRRAGELTVVWHSLVRQYVQPEEWALLEDAVTAARASDRGAPIVWAAMEPGLGASPRIAVTLGERSGESPRRVASTGDHGHPMIWEPG